MLKQPSQHRDISAYLMPKDWLETLEAVGLTNADLLRRCVRTHALYEAVIALRA